MSVAARVAREMDVKLGNEVRAMGTEGRGEPQGSGSQPHCPRGPTLHSFREQQPTLHR